MTVHWNSGGPDPQVRSGGRGPVVLGVQCPQARNNDLITCGSSRDSITIKGTRERSSAPKIIGRHHARLRGLGRHGDPLRTGCITKNPDASPCSCGRPRRDEPEPSDVAINDVGVSF